MHAPNPDWLLRVRPGLWLIALLGATRIWAAEDPYATAPTWSLRTSMMTSTLEHVGFYATAHLPLPIDVEAGAALYFSGKSSWSDAVGGTAYLRGGPRIALLNRLDPSGRGYVVHGALLGGVRRLSEATPAFDGGDFSGYAPNLAVPVDLNVWSGRWAGYNLQIAPGVSKIVTASQTRWLWDARLSFGWTFP
jgi:hypothetical protein